MTFGSDKSPVNAIEARLESLSVLTLCKDWSKSNFQNHETNFEIIGSYSHPNNNTSSYLSDYILCNKNPS